MTTTDEVGLVIRNPSNGGGGDALMSALRLMLQRRAANPIQGADPLSGTFPGTLLGDALPVVPDANILRDDVIYSCRHGRRTVLINAANSQFLRLYCAQHVIDEVFEHAAEWALQAGVPYEVFLRRWMDEYLPVLRVVSVEPSHRRLLTPTERQRLARLDLEDGDDVPSAILALLLGAYYLTKDRAAITGVYGAGADLVQHERWVEILKAGGNAGELGQMLHILANVVALVGRGVFAGLRRLPPAATVVFLAASAGFGVVAYRRSSPEARESFRSGLGAVLLGVGELLAAYQRYLAEFRAAAPSIPSWAELAVVCSQDAVLTRASLHCLCRSGMSDRSADELSSMLPRLGVAQGVGKVRSALRTSTLVSEPWRGRWQVGGVAAALSVIEAHAIGQPRLESA